MPPNPATVRYDPLPPNPRARFEQIELTSMDQVEPSYMNGRALTPSGIHAAHLAPSKVYDEPPMRIPKLPFDDDRDRVRRAVDASADILAGQCHVPLRDRFRARVFGLEPWYQHVPPYERFRLWVDGWFVRVPERVESVANTRYAGRKGLDQFLADLKADRIVS